MTEQLIFSRSADTFRSRVFLAITLSWIGGFVNVVTLIAAGETVSHQTGNTTRLAELLAKKWSSGKLSNEFGRLLLLLLCFWAGAVLSGFLTEGVRRYKRKTHYALPMIVEVILLVFVLIGMLGRREAGEILNSYPIFAAALAMGLQNATITNISGSVVRTTHLTGVLTDFGIECGTLIFLCHERLRRGRGLRTLKTVRVAMRGPSIQRMGLLSCILSSFATGAFVGAAAFLRFGPIAMLAPIVFLMALIIAVRRTCLRTGLQTKQLGSISRSND